MAWYVVYRGKVLGVYKCWAKCNAQVSGFSNNCFRGFVTKEEAEASYLEFISSEKHPLLVETPPAVVNKSKWTSTACIVLSYLVVVLLLVLILVWK
jgi:viroplasmin and RNaseH domain-containing protein